MQYNSIEVASYIVHLCTKLGYEYNNTKIQKLLYCCYGAILVVCKERLCDEYPRAWQYGPVFPRVFNHIQKCKPLPSYQDVDNAPDKVKNLLSKVVTEFGKYSASSLSNWTHQKGSPWDRVVNENEAGLNGFIPDGFIAEYFETHVVQDEKS